MSHRIGYAHTFKFTNYDDAPCKVIYDLKEVAGGVEFSLITEKCADGYKNRKNPWRKVVHLSPVISRALVETGKPQFSGKMVVALGPLMGLFTPKVCRSENWPLLTAG